MSEPWTPGPWTWEACDGTQGFNACVGVPDSAVAECMASDARLISLAPEMAEALSRLTEQTVPDMATAMDMAVRFRQEARDLLARARGTATQVEGKLSVMQPWQLDKDARP